jgi:uncharacterized repeat protein (TIGR02543 family)
VSYDANGGAGTAPPPQTAAQLGESVTLAGGNGLTKEGYWFNGWNTEADGTGTAYGANASFTPQASVTLYAQWVDLAVTRYTVSYDANGASFGYAPASQEALYGSTIALKGGSASGGTELSRAGFKFNGWNTKADGTGTSYAAGDSLTVAGDITLYAQWTAAYTVSYDKNGRDLFPLPSPQKAVPGSTITLAGVGLELTNYYNSYVFSGWWNTEADGTGTAYAAGDSLTVTADITLYAQYTNLYEVEYDRNGNANANDITPASQVVKSGSTITLSAGSENARRFGKGLSSWNTKADGTGVAYAGGASITVTADITLYAQWEDLPLYTVTYSANGGTGTVSSQGKYSGETLTLGSGSGLTRFGHTFDGWNTAADGTGTSYAEGDSLTVTADTTIYAKWKEIVEISERVYVGVVAFNDATSEYALSNNLGRAKLFIHDKDNDVDSTALCYAVSKAATLFGAAGLPPLDNLFVVSFTDGLDNSSSFLYTGVPQATVYDQAKTDLEKITGMRSYAIGFGTELNATSMQKLVVNKGQYRTATSANLNTVFQEIAYSVMASSKNMELVTQSGTYTDEYPKYFKITVTAQGNTTYTATIKCKLVGTTFTIIEPDPYLSFNAPAAAVVTGSKMRIPLNNLKYERDGAEWYISDVAVQVSYDDTDYRTDTEDGSASTSNNTKKTGVVLVLDCSKSLGESFESVKTAAYSFIDTLRSTDTQD